jgi:hypothetical protein
MNLEELKSRIEAEALRRQAARDGFTLEAVEAYLGKGLPVPPELGIGTPPPPPEPLTYAYFANLHGVDLANACYRVLLGRVPDEPGLRHCLQLLSQGVDKAFIVGGIAYSPEGRQRGVRVQGLSIRFAVAAASRIAVVGMLVEWAWALATAHWRAREQRAFQNEVHARLDAIARYSAASNSQIAMRIESLRSVLEHRD